MKIRHNKLIVALLICSTVASAQTWTELNPPPNIFNDAIYSIAIDTIGNIYAAGKFKNTSNEFIVAQMNGKWEEVKNGNNALHATNVIYCITTDRTGNLYAAGAFTNSSGNYYIAKWNGTTWSQVGSGANALNPNGQIYSICVDNSNNIYVAGGFTDNTSKRYVAKWNGTSWAELGVGANALNANGLIYSVTTDNTGNIYAAGHFTNAGGKYYVAKWDGVSWTEVTGTAPLNANDYINCIAVDNSGNVYAGGAFRNISGDYYVAKFNNNSWAEVGSGSNAIHANGPINAITVNNSGNIYAGGFGTNINGGTNVVKWNGTSWNQIFEVGASINSAIRTIAIDNAGNVYAGGDFKNISGHNYVAKWDGVTMHELGRAGEFLPSINGIHLITADILGRVYAIGPFWTNQGQGITDVGKWNGVGWTQMKNNNSPLNVENVNAITTDNSGNVYIGGSFINQNGEFYVAKWDGTNWNELSNSSTPLHAVSPISWLATDSAGNIYATATFNDGGLLNGIARWNGSTWTKFGSAAPSSITRLVAGPPGIVYVTGYFTNSNGKYYVAKVDANSWTELGSGANALNANSWINSITIDGNGNLYAGGNFTNGSFNAYVAKWNGTTWSQLGTIPNASVISSLTADSAGNVFAAISANANPQFYVGKWNGSNWSELVGTNSLNANSNVNTIAKDNRGNIYAAGLFGNSGSQNYVAGFGTSLLILQHPVLSVSADQYCNAAGNQTIKILNLPDTSRISVVVSLDAVRLNINADSSFTVNVSALSTGIHIIKVSFSIGTDTFSLNKNFVVIPAVTPDVNVSANITVVTNLNPVIITATNASGGGTTPLFTFAKDRTITTILQAESINNVLNLNPATLAMGNNWIYVRMRTSDTCYTAQINIDSINIIRTAATGLTDIDFPNQEISVYPIPFNESFTIQGLQNSKSYSISLINSAGQIILQRNIRNSTSVNIDQFSAKGALWLRIYDNSKRRLLGIVALIKD